MKRGEKKLIKKITDMMFRSLQFAISDKLVLGDFIIEHAKLINNPFTTFDSYRVRIIRIKDCLICSEAEIIVTIKNKKYKVGKILSFDEDYIGFVGKKKLIEKIKKSCRF
jgi:hypothetical protein